MGFGLAVYWRPGTGWCWLVLFHLCFLSEKLNRNCENDRCSLYKDLSSHLKTKQSYLIGTHVKSHNFCRFGENGFLIQANNQFGYLGSCHLVFTILAWVSPQQFGKT